MFPQKLSRLSFEKCNAWIFLIIFAQENPDHEQADNEFTSETMDDRPEVEESNFSEGEGYGIHAAEDLGGTLESTAGPTDLRSSASVAEKGLLSKAQFPHKRKRRQVEESPQSAIVQDFICKATAALQPSPEKKQDDAEIFGRLVAQELKGMSGYNRDMAKIEIQRVLFDIKHQRPTTSLAGVPISYGTSSTVPPMPAGAPVMPSSQVPTEFDIRQQCSSGSSFGGSSDAYGVAPDNSYQRTYIRLQ